MRSKLLIALAALASLPAAVTFAESDAPRARTVEEIIVTAQKREEKLGDVPISITVVDDDFIKEQGITDYRDLALHVPNAHVDTGNGLFPDINIRGFGSALSNKAFEQSVGLSIDGVPYGRSPYFQSGLFDVERVEVLRGPQGTLFGKNTTAGLLNVVTKNPTDEFTGSIVGSLGELSRRRLEVAVGGPLMKGLLNFRIAGLYDERDGLIANTTADFVAGANRRMNDRDRKAVRVKLGAPDVLGANVVLSYEHADFEFDGIGWEFLIAPPQVVPFYRQFDPNFDLEPDNYRGSVDTHEYNRNKVDTVVLNASYPLGGWTIDAVGGYSMLTERSLTDDDFGPAPSIFSKNADDNPQTTFELRATSPRFDGFLGLASLFGRSLGATDFTAGFFYQRRELQNSSLAININVPVFALFLQTNGIPLTIFPGLEDVPPLTPGIILPVSPAILAQLLGPTAGHEETTSLFEQSSDAFAGFGQLNWHLTDRFAIESGYRISHEKKTGSFHRVTTEGTGILFPILGEMEFSTTRTVAELAFTPRVSATYAWTDDINLFATWAKGFKAGGFNEQAANPNDTSLTFDPERATSWELGAKMRLLDGTATLNVGLFHHTVTDLQVFTLPPLSAVSSVVNAGKARAQGVEVDGAWLPTSWLTVVGTLGFNDAEYLEFPFGQCSFDRPDTDGDGDGHCDLSGEPLFRTPKWAITLAPSVRFPLTSFPALGPALPSMLRGVDWIGGLAVEYQDVQLLSRSDDPRSRQPSFFRVNGNIGFGNDAQGWTLRLVAENLTDQATDAFVFDVPFGGGNFTKIPEPPRLLFAELQWRF